MFISFSTHGPAERAVLPAANRMRRSADFSSVFRGGSRFRATNLVVHHRPAHRGDSDPVIGLVVSKSVGNSVIRHQVSRRLRAQLAARLAVLPTGSATVVRALEPAATATSAEIASDLDRALTRLIGSP